MVALEPLAASSEHPPHRLPAPGGQRTPVTDSAATPAWTRIRAELRRAVPEATWHLWLEPISARALEDGLLVVTAPAGRRAWIAGRYGRVVQACAAAVLGPGVTVQWADADADAAALPVKGSTAGCAPAKAPNPRFTFEQFVIGDGNRMAHAAALAVAEMPGIAYNPLYICGAPGLGKTHLLHSIAAYVEAHGNGLTVRHTSAEAFTDAYVAAVHGSGGGMEAFRAAHRDVDVLLVDDVQFLERKQKTEEEFFHTFDTLVGAGAQVVLTSDRPPRDLSAMEDRLRERFEAGLVCEVTAPDQLTRRTILRKRVLQDGLCDAIDDGALDVVADRVASSVRALEGALIRIVAFGSLTGRPVDDALAGEVLDGLYPDLKPAARTVRDIQEATAAAFGVPLEELLSSSRAAPVAWPRQVAMYLARELTDQSLPAIGSAFGGRSHTTILHAWRRTAERLAGDAEASDAVQRLRRELGGRDADRSS